MRYVKAISILMLTIASESFVHAAALTPGTETDEERFRQRRLLLGLIVGLLVVGVVYIALRRRKSAVHDLQHPKAQAPDTLEPSSRNVHRQ